MKFDMTDQVGRFTITTFLLPMEDWDQSLADFCTLVYKDDRAIGFNWVKTAREAIAQHHIVMDACNLL